MFLPLLLQLGSRVFISALGSRVNHFPAFLTLPAGWVVVTKFVYKFSIIYRLNNSVSVEAGEERKQWGNMYESFFYLLLSLSRSFSSCIIDDLQPILPTRPVCPPARLPACPPPAPAPTPPFFLPSFYSPKLLPFNLLKKRKKKKIQLILWGIENEKENGKEGRA